MYGILKNGYWKKYFAFLYFVDIGEGIEMPPWVTRKPSGKAAWKIAKEELESYQDVLAPRLLEDFGVDDIDEWASDFEQSNEPDSLGKVQIWLSENTSLLDANTDVEMKDELLLDESTLLTDEKINETVATDSDGSEMSKFEIIFRIL